MMAAVGEDTRRGKKEGSPSLQVFLEEERHQPSLGDSEWLSRQRYMSRIAGVRSSKCKGRSR